MNGIADNGVPMRADAPAVARLGEALRAAGFTEPAVCERLGIDSIFDLETIDSAKLADDRPADTLDVLIHLFLMGLPAARDGIDALLPEALRADLQEAGLLSEARGSDGRWIPAVLLAPAGDLYVAFDIGHDRIRAGAGESVPVDVVYPGIAKNTGELLAVLPADPCGHVLDLCSGSGIAALAAARLAEHAWAVDVTARSTRFAEFNIALNGLANVTALQGDLWQPVAGRTFDRIVAHPPYVPSAEPDYIYRAGGEDGEQITRRIIEDLHAHLAPGGRFYCSCMMTDREGAPVEQRLRAMLGDREAEFDVFVVTRSTLAPADFVFGRRGIEPSPAEIAMLERMRTLGIRRLVVCTIVIRRHAGDRPAVTVRRMASSRVSRTEVEWLMAWEAARFDPDLPHRLARCRPRLRQAVRLETVSRSGDAGWVTESCRLVTDWPFRRTMEVPLEVARFVAGCDGTLTVSEQLERARRAGLVRDGAAEIPFAADLVPLFANGILMIDE